MNNYILSNIDNYKTELDSNEHILFLKYIGLIHELIQGCTESLFIQNVEYLKHVLIMGIKNTFYIYNFLLLYTKNLELSAYHTQKSIIYYIEFISQIGEDTQNPLNSKDATLFIYKKTIFDVNEEIRKNYIETSSINVKLKSLQLYIDLYNNIIIQVISKYDLKTNKLSGLQKIVFTKLYKIVEAVIQLPIIYKQQPDIVTRKLETLYILLNMFNNSHSYPFIEVNYLYLIEYCIKKIHKLEFDIDKIKNKLNCMDIETKLQDYSVCKFFNYLLN